MAKQSDRLAAAVKAEKAGSLPPPTGLFAEENEFDRRALWRIGSWGAAAVGAVTLAVMSNQWSLGFRRGQVAAADLARQAQQIQSLAKESQNETRQIASAIETLNNDRDRLFSRVTVIEQGLDSVTGALAKQSKPAPVASATPQASAAAQASNMPAGTPQVQQPAASAQPPAPAPVATTAVASSAADKPRADTARTDAAASAAAVTNSSIVTNAGAAATATVSPAAGSSLMAKSTMGPADPAAPKLIEASKPAYAKPDDAKFGDPKSGDVRAGDTALIKRMDLKGVDMKMAEAKVDAKGTDAPLAASSEVVASAEEAETPVASVAVKRTDFAIDLGSANSLGGLRALWRGVRHLNAELGTLNPIVVIREGHTGPGMQLHLAAGPLKDAAAAAKICAVLTETRHACETTVYDGQRLAMKTDEAPSPPAIRAAGADARSEAKSSETKSSDARPDAKLDANADGKSDAKPGSSKRGWYRRAKKEEPPPPPPAPPEPTSTSTFSSLFGRK